MLNLINGERRENGILKRILYLTEKKIEISVWFRQYDTSQGDHEVSLCTVSALRNHWLQWII